MALHLAKSWPNQGPRSVKGPKQCACFMPGSVVRFKHGGVFLFFLQGAAVAHRSCVHAYSAGTALDYVWPYLLRYPPDEIGIIDAVCVSHIDWGAIRQMVLPRYPTWAPYG